MTQRRGDWMQTFTGRQFWPLDPRPEEVAIEDIAHSLALQCRFAGHCRVPYSVAEHSVRVSLLLEQRTPSRQIHLQGLLHDASEAYLVDLPRPVKRCVQGYAEAEDRVARAVAEAFGLGDAPADPFGLIKRADNVLLATEARDLMRAPRDWLLDEKPLPDAIEPWDWRDAEAFFLARFQYLRGVAP